MAILRETKYEIVWFGEQEGNPDNSIVNIEGLKKIALELAIENEFELVDSEGWIKYFNHGKIINDGYAFKSWKNNIEEEDALSVSKAILDVLEVSVFEKVKQIETIEDEEPEIDPLDVMNPYVLFSVSETNSCDGLKEREEEEEDDFGTCPQCEQEDTLNSEGICSHCDGLRRKWDFEARDGTITVTEDNINLYYELMSDEDINKYRDLIDVVINKRLDSLSDFLGFIDDLIPSSIHTVDTVLSNNGSWEYYLKSYIFGIQDTLKPIDEYIEEIKASSEYKEYLIDKVKANAHWYDITDIEEMLPWLTDDNFEVRMFKGKKDDKEIYFELFTEDNSVNIYYKETHEEIYNGILKSMIQ